MHTLCEINAVHKNIAMLSASQFISDIGTASYISFVNLWLIQVFKDSALVGTIVSITEIALFFLSPLITTLIKGKNIKTMLVVSDHLRALIMVVLFFLVGHINAVMIVSIFILLSTLNCVFDGAVMVVIKRIGSKSDVVKLNTFLILLANISLLISQYVGGKLFTINGIKEILIINAVSFFISVKYGITFSKAFSISASSESKHIKYSVVQTSKALFQAACFPEFS